MYKFDEKKHVHTLNGKPLIGTTSLIKEIMPPPLSWWASGKALEMLGWTNPKLVKEEDGLGEVSRFLKALPELSNNEASWYDFLQKCYKNHANTSKKRANEGKDTHAKVEEAVKEAITNHGGLLRESYEDEEVERFASWGRGKQFIYSEINVYSEILWLGGQLDLIYKEMDEYYLADIKTSKAIYPSQFIQQGLYDCQQEENGFYDAGGNKLGDPLKIKGYTVVTVPPAGGIEVKTYRGTQQLKELGVSFVNTYKVIQELKTICQK